VAEEEEGAEEGTRLQAHLKEEEEEEAVVEAVVAVEEGQEELT